MNDKDKQIEIQKMQQEIFDSCAWRFSRHPEDYREVANDIGEDLYNLGYRNCKDKVVLSMEEFDEFRKDRAEVIFLKKQITDQARKETAREILKELYLHFSADYLLGMRNEYKDWKYADFIKRYAQRYEVVIGEE